MAKNSQQCQAIVQVQRTSGDQKHRSRRAEKKAKTAHAVCDKSSSHPCWSSSTKQQVYDEEYWNWVCEIPIYSYQVKGGYGLGVNSAAWRWRTELNATKPVIFIISINLKISELPSKILGLLEYDVMMQI